MLAPSLTIGLLHIIGQGIVHEAKDLERGLKTLKQISPQSLFKNETPSLISTTQT